MPDAYSTAVLADSPIAYWRVGEPSGTNAADSAGSHTGTYTAGVTLAQAGAIPSSSNTAIRLTTGAITVPDASDIGFANHAFSIEVWIEPDDATTASQQFMGFAELGSGLGWEVGLGMITSQKISLLCNSWVTSTGTVPTDGLWHHIVVTGPADCSVIKFYIDGATAGTGGGAFAIQPWVGTKFIGQGSWGGQQFVGGLDEIALYDFELSAGRVLAHYDAATLVTAATGPVKIIKAVRTHGFG